MNELHLSTSMIARSFWTELMSSTRAEEARESADEIFRYTDSIQPLYGQQTGSISRKSAELIWLLARYFGPKQVAEIGTYIGRSTLALRYGADPTLEFLATCDGSFDCWKAPPDLDDSKVQYFGKTNSADMFQKLIKDGRKIDLFLLDGRISAADLEAIESLKTDNSIFVIDDFEGVEKGVTNAILLREKFPSLLLLAPENKLSNGWNDAHCLAVMLPASNIRLSSQQRLPLSLM
ncbi:MAG: hypothetical protein RJQ14_12100 [Marinoscillum sp.]|jgi:predicted O-methyltransferase YrrM